MNVLDENPDFRILVDNFEQFHFEVLFRRGDHIELASEVSLVKDSGNYPIAWLKTAQVELRELLAEIQATGVSVWDPQLLPAGEALLKQMREFSAPFNHHYVALEKILNDFPERLTEEEGPKAILVSLVAGTYDLSKAVKALLTYGELIEGRFGRIPGLDDLKDELEVLSLMEKASAH